MNKRIKIQLEDLEQNMSYKFLETASDKSDIEAIARKRGLVVPSPDIALFSGIYTKADKFNVNGARLSSKEIAKALDTLILKPVTLNHNEKKIAGIVLDVKFEDNKDVIVWGAIYKDNYGKEYAKLKRGFENGEIGLSYELYGTKISCGNGKYDWSDVFFCGCGILDKNIRPAMYGSKVLEFAMVKEKEIGANETALTVCNKCGFKFDSSTVKTEEPGGIKCPSCKEIIGINQSTASTSDITCTCPNCSNTTWNNVYDLKDKIIAKCTSCEKSYQFEIEEYNKNAPKLGINLALEGKVNCYQCGKTIKYPIWANREKTALICKHCGLRFMHIRKAKEFKYIVKSIMEYKEENMTELQKTFASVKKAEDVTDELIQTFETASEEDKNTLDKEVKEIAEKVIKDKKKISYDCECIKCGAKAKSKEHCKELKCLKCGGQMRRVNRPGVGRDKTRLDKVLKIAKKMKAELKSKKKETANEVLKKGIKKLALEIMNLKEDIKVVGEYEKELASVKENHIKEVVSVIKEKEKEIAKVKDTYKEEAKTIIERKTELGEYAQAMSDDQLLNEKDYKIAKLEKELRLKKTKEVASTEEGLEVGSEDGEEILSEEEKKEKEYNERLEKAHKDVVAYKNKK